jgi:ribosomal protein S18 acetylase RimI-like enzyme
MPLREAVEGDAAALGALHVASWRETYSGMMPDHIVSAATVEARTAMWTQILRDPRAGRAAVYVVEDDGRVVGFGACGAQRDATLADAGFSGEIGAIYVLRSHQGRGAGRSLMRVLSQSLLVQGHRAMSLWVLRENAAARAFYTTLDGKTVGERVDERPGASLVEIAYGWRDLSRLAQ